MGRTSSLFIQHNSIFISVRWLLISISANLAQGQDGSSDKARENKKKINIY